MSYPDLTAHILTVGDLGTKLIFVIFERPWEHKEQYTSGVQNQSLSVISEDLSGLPRGSLRERRVGCAQHLRLR